MKHDESLFISPFSLRYASQEMSHLFSLEFKHLTWRKLWIALAESEKELGLPITQEQITSLKKGLKKIDFKAADHFEKIYHHDVMAHIHAYGKQCPEAKGIIHLGATSCYVTDNTDLIQMKEAFLLLKKKLKIAIKNLSTFAKQHKNTPTLSYTHFQSAQPTTVGKRACLWIQDLLIDYETFETTATNLRFLGLKGATGTQSSFLNLFDGDEKKVIELEKKVAKKMDFSKLFLIAGQTYSRKQDITVMHALSSFAASLHKFGTDLRLLSHLKELSEPFAKTQVGSSAMPHKKNPIYAERLCGIARFLMALQENALYTEATQWLERSLDDSSNRRLYIPEAFLAADSLLEILVKITNDLQFSNQAAETHLERELPFLLTEIILMHAAKHGKNRQEIHERLREYAHTAQKKGHNKDTFLETLAKDKQLGMTLSELKELSSSHLTGRAASQVTVFLKTEVDLIF